MTFSRAANFSMLTGLQDLLIRLVEDFIPLYLNMCGK